MNEYMTNNEQVRERMKGGSEGKNGRREERGRKEFFKTQNQPNFFG